MAGRAIGVVVALVWVVTVGAASERGSVTGSSVGSGFSRTSGQTPHVPADFFQTSNTCIVCHNGLVTPSGEDVSIGSDWRGSMMANSARDPYWLASVRREIMDHPGAREAIEDECSICHMPALTYTARQNGTTGRIFDLMPADGPGPPSDPLAADGVSCSICHQIGTAGLGMPESFTGGYVIDTTTAFGARPVYGPFEVDQGRTTLMRSVTGFQPAQGAHVQTSELCASCHTLITTALGPGHEAIGRLPEQMPYVEWQQSAYNGTQTCQDCHMPVVTEPTAITGVLGQPREGLSRHTFRGGNFFMMRLLNRYRDELGVAATPAEINAAITRTIDHLVTGTARLDVESATLSGGRLNVTVAVANLAGHKFPTAYPSRRAWLHVRVHDGNGRVVFESGAFQPDGSIAGNDADADAGRFEPHFAEITSADQVQIYESVMAGGNDAPTTGLLTAVRYLKDNRLLPEGFPKASAPADVAVHGTATTDASFDSGGDEVRYAIDLAGATGPFTVTVQLWFQPIAFRWAENLRDYDAAEPRRFMRYWDSLRSQSAIVVARASATVR